MRWESVSPQDEKIIFRQIQRPPRNLHGIARRCRQQCPQVLVNKPLPQAEPDADFFPTVFWLTCPEAVRLVSKIEAQGVIEQLQQQINRSQVLADGLHDAHHEYIYIRRTLLDVATRSKLRNQRSELARRVEHLGIGGVHDFKGVKCLHMHYAHFLATRNNPLGLLVEKMIHLSSQTWQCQKCHETISTAGVAE